MEDFYTPSEIKFWPEHIRWTLEHLNELEDGNWPRDPRETGYTDAPGKRRKHGSYFETPVILAAEVTARVDRCGTDGTLTRQCLADGWDVLTLAELMHTEIYRIEYRVNRVVKYCSGWRRKRLTYSEFSRRHGIRMYHRRVKC